MKKTENATVTLSAVAKAANVSPSAVSKTLLGGGGRTTRVSKKTEERIRRVAAGLNYHPNLIAQRLANPKNNIIGIICDSTNINAFARQFIQIQHMAFAENFRLQMGLVHDDLDSIRNYTEDFLGNNIHNVICFAHSYPKFADRVPELFTEFKNAVFVEKPATDHPFSYVACDLYQSYLDCTAFLASRKKKRVILHLSNYRDPGNEMRRKGFADGCKRAGLDCDSRFCFEGGPPGLEHLTKNVEAFLDYALPLEPDALCGNNDEFMMLCRQSIQQRGYKGKEILLYSNDRIFLGRLFSPPFCGTVIDYTQIACEAARIVIENAKLPSDRPAEIVQKLFPISIFNGSVLIKPTETERNIYHEPNPVV